VEWEGYIYLGSGRWIGCDGEGCAWGGWVLRGCELDGVGQMTRWRGARNGADTKIREKDREA
jgi:hypothetical protein